MSNKKKVAVIIGAGPAGLTAAYELLTRTDIHPIVIERDPQYMGGISRTVNYKGNRIDIGGHRFFSKSDRVMKWWSEMLPILASNDSQLSISYQRTTATLTDGLKRAAASDGARTLNIRPRRTRIIHGGKFFAYPIELSFDTLLKLGLKKTLRIGYTYLAAALFPRQPEKSLEDFFINRFGSELYKTFFKSYTEKVWGTSCTSMSAEWGKQRVKGLSIIKAITHAVRKVLHIGAFAGKGVETSLIEQFLYPTLGPGQMWETVAQKVRDRGGELLQGTEVIGVTREGNHIVSVRARNQLGTEVTIEADYILSSTDVQGLMRAMTPQPPAEVLSISDRLQYRDFLTVGLLLSVPPVESNSIPFADVWLYIHEESIKAGRIQLFHNWSPDLVSRQGQGWVGLEYFCNMGEALWKTSDPELIELAERELEQLGLLEGAEVLDGTVVRQEKAYPGYFGSYAQFGTVKSFLDSIDNLFPIGRNGMHRYNNQDHSMLAAMTAVDLILSKTTDKAKLWKVNTEDEYHEQK